MDFGFTEKEVALQKKLRGFVANELPPGWKEYGAGEEYATDEGWAVTRQMSRKLAARGWLTMSWPKEHGGLGASRMEHLIYREEMGFHSVPGTDMGVGGVRWVGPSLMLFGSEEQKKEHLPGIAAGETYWCTGYSEPDAGSDLASLQCQAARQGDDYVLNGQKVWSSAAHRCAWYWLAARTDARAPKHKGISLFLLDLKSPGVTIKPLINLAGYPGFCEVFLDNVRIPKNYLVGEENRGWYYVAVALDFERTSGIDTLSRGRQLLFAIMDYARVTKRDGEALSKNPIMRHDFAELAIECEVGRLMCYRIAWMEDRGLVPNYEASMVKNFGAELGQRIANAGIKITGLYGQLGAGPRAPIGGMAQRSYLVTCGDTIAAGTSEINRNIIATRGLGLPRG